MVDSENRTIRLEAREASAHRQGRDHVAPDVIERSSVAFNITPQAFRYLAIQHGSINDLADNRTEWDKAYHESIFRTYENIAPYLPERVARIMDIGSGLGGIDVLLNRHYCGHVEVVLIDGASDEPICTSHASTFNSERVTREFLKANGVRKVSYYAPAALPTPSPFNLIVSFASWCFHYPPGHYLSFIRQCLRPGGILIVDLRRERPKWKTALASEFKEVDCAHRGKKFERMIYAG